MIAIKKQNKNRNITKKPKKYIKNKTIKQYLHP